MLAALIAIAFQSPQIQMDDKADEYLRTSLQQYVDEGAKRVEKFFGAPFPKPYKVEVVPSRAAFDKIFKDRWGEDHTESWAVGAGVSDAFYILSPRVWKTEATEHDPNDAGHIRRIIAHELTHVYHGQINTSHDFDGMDDMSWLIEGLATYVSGQMDEEHKGQDLEAIKAAKAPTKLADAWTGRYRYAVSGSLVRYVDHKYGRKTLVKILRLTKQQDVLNALHVSEQKLISDWKTSVDTHNHPAEVNRSTYFAIKSNSRLTLSPALRSLKLVS